jgi:hypothetical protein
MARTTKLDVIEPDAIAQFRGAGQPGADEIGKRSLVLRLGDGEAVELRDPA